ncbi:MAG TPA: ArsA-related P-loop ATPase [Gemmatimonadales bacterium]|jgi:anion-transporting  ArsA/GET3 family ATPase|nr:ArsA-related P-loop ATPase [Gemmatimonadales bacterium]
MPFDHIDRPLLVVVGSGGVGKTTLAAALGLASAAEGTDTLVMTFDPSLRLKDALGVGEEATTREVRVAVDAPGRLDVSLLDARRTFDRLIRQYAPSDAAAERIFGNRFYQNLAGNLAGILEYMAVERLFEVASSRRYRRIILDTPPTRQALDFLEAPDRIIEFLESGPVRIALRPWFDASGRLIAAPLKLVGRSLESWLDRLVGLELLRDMAEFFQAFGPLYDGFRQRAGEVRELLRARGTLFLLVAGPGSERIPDTLFFARRLREAGLHLGPIVVNQVHPQVPDAASATGSLAEGLHLIDWLGTRDHQGLAELRGLLGPGDILIDLPLLPNSPTNLAALSALGDGLLHRLAATR